MLGLSSLGGHLLPAAATWLCVGIGSVLLLAYARHALRAAHPVIDLRLLKLPTFGNGVLAGSLFRIGLGASPFLLPLLLQLGFGLNPLQSGLLTCASAVGAMFMKTLTVKILRRWGFRRVLTVNGVLASASLAVYAFFAASTPHALIVAILLASGCLRSLQFTALGAIAFADIEPPSMSQASSINSMAQRLAQSMGIAVGAYLLQLASTVAGHVTIVAADFGPAFIGVSLISLTSVLLHRRLPREAGREVSGHVQA